MATASAFTVVSCEIEWLKARTSSLRRKKEITLSSKTTNVPTLIPPAVLREPPPININNITTNVEVLVIEPVSMVFRPEERGAVA